MKYNWENIPAIIIAISTDERGYKIGFYTSIVGNKSHMNSIVLDLPYKNEFKGDWQDSLELRKNGSY